MNGRAYRIILTLFRIILSAVFIFSGFIKSIDPWGTAIKVGEYISAVNLEFSDNIYLGLSFLLCGGELLLGLLLLFGVWKRVFSTVAMLFMSVMTLLTLWIAIWNPVADCGCFGDAVKLTNWETFFKNLVLLPISIMLWRAWSRPGATETNTMLSKSMRVILPICLLSFISFGVCFYSLKHLPIIDFLPYKVGVDLLSDFKDQSEVTSGDETKLIYKNIDSGKLSEFTLNDTEWYDTLKWEYVETITPTESSNSAINEFMLFDGTDFITENVLAEERVLLIAIWDMSTPIATNCMTNLVKLVDDLSAKKYKIYCITPSSLDKYPRLNIGGATIQTLNIDGKTLKSAMRSEVGIFEIDNGIITSKRSCYNAHN